MGMNTGKAVVVVGVVGLLLGVVEGGGATVVMFWSSVKHISEFNMCLSSNLCFLDKYSVLDYLTLFYRLKVTIEWTQPLASIGS